MRNIGVCEVVRGFCIFLADLDLVKLRKLTSDVLEIARCDACFGFRAG
jgi:hypothetical protein